MVAIRVGEGRLSDFLVKEGGGLEAASPFVLLLRIFMQISGEQSHEYKCVELLRATVLRSIRYDIVLERKPF